VLEFWDGIKTNSQIKVQNEIKHAQPGKEGN
jgi:hypothetical protein